MTPKLWTPFYLPANKILLAAPDDQRAYIKKRDIAGRLLQPDGNRNRRYKFILKS